jgi:cytochrome P450
MNPPLDPKEILDRLNDSRVLLDPSAFYEQMRRDSPLVFIPELETWMVFRYGDVERVLTDFATFSSKMKFPPEQKDFTQSVNFLDPPRHKSVRSLAQQAFTLKRVEAMAGRIEELAQTLLDAALERNEFDFILDYANPLPVIVIAEIMGVPAAQHAYFTDLSNRVVMMDTAAVTEMATYFRELIEERKVSPRDDLITSLVQAYEEGERLSEQELVDFCIVLLVGGNETTAKLIGNALLCLRDSPETQQTLLERPEMLGAFIEEVLRLRAPVQSMARMVRHDTELHGQTLQAGQTIEAFIGAANLDPKVFEAPTQLRLGRKGRHLAFGNGIHFCLGAPLARLEAKVALGHALQRLPKLSIQPNADLMPIPFYGFHGVVSLPIKWR